MSLTTEQERALQELLAYLPARKEATAPAAPPGLLDTWLGLSDESLQARLQGLLARKRRLEDQMLTWVENSPLDAVLIFLATSAAAFYAAEKDANPKIKSYVDAFYYIATCASVGYADIFATTQKGRAIAALVMIVGPALAARSLDRPLVA
jgi:hypothetical protein